MSHGVTPEPPTGSEQYREGWRDGYEQAQLDMRAELAQLHAIRDRAAELTDAPGPIMRRTTAFIRTGVWPQARARSPFGGQK